MCLSYPAKIIEITGSMALVSLGSTMVNASLELLDEVKTGDYVLLHTGFAIEKIDEEAAFETIRLLDEIRELGRMP
jgi:hydrogenase expression/formation protein HypC